jgi:uncharacterized membrane protein
MHTLDLVTIVVTGLMVGTELTVSLFINPIMWQLDSAAQSRALSLFARRLGFVMPFWYATCLILLITETVLRRGTTAFPTFLSASILWAATIVYTVALLVPINNRVAALDTGDDFQQWIKDHKRWDGFHRLRIALILITLVMATHALLSAA